MIMTKNIRTWNVQGLSTVINEVIHERVWKIWVHKIFSKRDYQKKKEREITRREDITERIIQINLRHSYSKATAQMNTILSTDIDLQ